MKNSIKNLLLLPALIAFLLSFTASNCFGTSLSFVGTGGYTISGNTVVLSAAQIQNNNIGGISGTIRLELWAFSSPYPGITIGYKLASHAVGQLSGGFSFVSISSGSIAFALPPPGTWYFSLQAREYVGPTSSDYLTRDYINFGSPVRVAGGAFYGDEQIAGLTSWQVIGNTVNLNVAQVNNICSLGVSGNLRLDLWATTTPYAGGTISGYTFGSVSLNPLTGGYSYNNINQTVAYSQPPAGSYYVTLTLSEFNNGSYVIVNYLNYATLLVSGSPPAVPTPNAATLVTSSGFTANWNSVAGATGYRGDVSTSSSFSSYVSGYQDVNVGNVTSGIVSGLTGGTTYYCRVRAYNAVGTSGNSSTITVTTLPNAPSVPVANAATSVTTSGFVANWSSASGATGYRMDISTSDTFASFVSGYQDLDVGNVASKSVSGLSVGTTYYYRVRAYNTGGTSGSSEIVTVATLPSPPSAPTATAATSLANSGFTANWSSASGATGYRLDVSTSSTFASYVSGYQNLDVGNVTSVSVSGLNVSTTYYYRVRAYNASGTSGNSGTITTTTLPNPPPAPTASAASGVTNSAFNANWSSASGATGYRLDISTDSLFTNYVSGYQDLDVGNVTTKNASGLNGSTIYYYRVRAYNAGGTGGNSGTITTTTLPNPPPVPTANAASNVTNSGFTANWSSASGATGYRLDVSTNNTFSNYVSGYQNLDVGNVLLRSVSNLTSGKTYYYRVRAYNGSGTSSNSSIITVTTLPPILNASRQGSLLVLSWPTNDPAFYLEVVTNASGSLLWVSNTGVPSIVNGKYTTTRDMTNKFRLYRLKK